MKIADLIKTAREIVGIRPDGDLAIEVILSYCMNISKERLFLSLDNELPGGVEQKFSSLLGRFSRGEPVSYLVNRKEFYGLDFFVDNRVLTPRPETELLVEKTIDFCKCRGKVKILDVGTGSGCIAIALAKHLPEVIISGSDISAEALEVAEFNAKEHGLADRIRFFEADLMDGIDECYDVIVANLPYIGTEKYNFVSAEARDFEPAVALFGGDNGLRLYEKLFSGLSGKSWRPKLLLGEFGFLQGVEMRELLNKYFGGHEIFFIDDYASIERVFMVNFIQNLYKKI
jgi:release factor glutamine methyltransferase